MSTDGNSADRYSAFIVRGAILGTGIIGLTLWVRNSRLFAIYNNVAQIPDVYFSRGLSLKGVAIELGPEAIIRLEHKPQFKFFSRKPKHQTLLNLRLAGISISDVGIDYLRNNIVEISRPVTFKLIKKDEKENIADVELFIRKTIVPVNLNAELVRRGYASVFRLSDPDHAWTLQSNSAYARLITRLLTSEKVAERRGIGMWQRSSWLDTKYEYLKSFPSTIVPTLMASPVVKLLVLLFELIKDLITLVVYLLKRGYGIGEKAAYATRNGYRSFAQGVENMNQSYLSFKSRILKRLSPK